MSRRRKSSWWVMHQRNWALECSPWSPATPPILPLPHASDFQGLFETFRGLLRLAFQTTWKSGWPSQSNPISSKSSKSLKNVHSFYSITFVCSTLFWSSYYFHTISVGFSRSDKNHSHTADQTSMDYCLNVWMYASSFTSQSHHRYFISNFFNSHLCFASTLAQQKHLFCRNNSS